MHGAQRRERAAEGDGQERAFAEILAWTAVTRFLVARLPLESLVDLPVWTPAADFLEVGRP